MIVTNGILETMDRLRADMRVHFDALYEKDKKTLVFGEGNADARVVLIGEAPGEQETLQGRPFVGKAGKNLDEFLKLSGICREDVYITNTVKFRPVKRSKAGNTVNRPPTGEEIRESLPFLIRELELIDPAVVVTLGNVPLRALLGNVTIGETHGRWLECGGRRVYPLYHPASVIYNQSLRGVYAEDVVRLGEGLRDEGYGV